MAQNKKKFMNLDSANECQIWNSKSPLKCCYLIILLLLHNPDLKT